MTYPRIASTPNSPSNINYDVDKKVDEAIQNFLMKLSQIGPELLSVGAPRDDEQRYLVRRNTKAKIGTICHSHHIVVICFRFLKGRADVEFL